jgi:hypothetical protein
LYISAPALTVTGAFAMSAANQKCARVDGIVTTPWSFRKQQLIPEFINAYGPRFSKVQIFPIDHNRKKR